MRRSKQIVVSARSVSVFVPMIVFLLVASAYTAGAQVPSDPCAQVTSAEVSAALGETVDAGQKAGTKTCSWVANKPTLYVKKGSTTFMRPLREGRCGPTKDCY